MGVKGVTIGIGVIADKSYSLKEITNFGDKILPPFTVRVNNVSKAKKVGKAISIANTNANWAKKINAEFNKK